MHGASIRSGRVLPLGRAAKELHPTNLMTHYKDHKGYLTSPTLGENLRASFSCLHIENIQDEGQLHGWFFPYNL